MAWARLKIHRSRIALLAASFSEASSVSMARKLALASASIWFLHLGAFPFFWWMGQLQQQVPQSLLALEPQALELRARQWPQAVEYLLPRLEAIFFYSMVNWNARGLPLRFTGAPL